MSESPAWTFASVPGGHPPVVPLRQIGIPGRWGRAWLGETDKGFFCNNLRLYLGDANTQTPEFKAFLITVAKLTSAAVRHAELPAPPPRVWSGMARVAPR